MKFLVDNQLPGALVRFLNAHGHEAQHVLDLKLDDADDAEIWRHAASEGRVVVSKDNDFLRLAARPDAETSFVWVRMAELPKTSPARRVRAFLACTHHGFGGRQPRRRSTLNA